MLSDHELKQAREKLASLQARQLALRDERRRKLAEADTLDNARAQTKAAYDELLVKVQETERAQAQRAVPQVVLADAPPVPVVRATRWQLVKALFGAR